MEDLSEEELRIIDKLYEDSKRRRIKQLKAPPMYRDLAMERKYFVDNEEITCPSRSYPTAV